MTPNEYQMEVMRTASGMTGGDDMEMLMLMGLMGMNGEAGEAIDVLKKSMFQGHELDKTHLARELGDVAFYLAVSAFGMGYTLEDILKLSVKKIHDRYPDGFDTKRSVNREAGDL